MAGFELDDRARDLMIRTVIGEAANQSPEGQQAVAAVIMNRANQSGMDVPGVVFARNQFEPWGNAKTRSYLEGIDPNDPKYQRVAANIAPFLSGEVGDPTNGATHFYAPRAQAALGRPAPKWDNGTGVDLGDHRFFNLGYRGHGAGKGNEHGIAGNPNAPAPGAVPAEGQQSPEMAQAYAASRGQAAAQPAQEMSFWQKLRGGREWNLQDALQGISIAAMARDNPQGAAALAAQFGKAKQSGGVSMVPGTFNKETGQAVFTDQRGNTVERRIASPFKELSDKEKEGFISRDNAISDYNNIIAKGNQYRQWLVDNPDVDFSPTANAARWTRTNTGTATAQDLTANEITQYFGNLTNESLRQNKGTQTEGDSKREYSDIVGQGFSNTAQMMRSLDRINEKTRGFVAREIRAQEGVLGGGYANLPKGDHADRYRTWQKAGDDFENEFAGRRDEWLKKKTGSASGTPAPAAQPRTNPGRASNVPEVGFVSKGYRFKGGNPADPNSWEKQ